MKHAKLYLLTLLILAFPTFSNVAHARSVFEDDFNSGSADGWLPIYGQWTVVDGQYVGIGVPASTDTKSHAPMPPGAPFTCTPTDTSVSPCGVWFSVIRAMKATNVEVELDMTAVNGSINRVVVMRAGNPCTDNVALNFRAGWFNDLAIQETKSGVQTVFAIPVGVSANPDSLHARIRLVGNHVTVWVDYNPVPFVDADFPFTVATSGAVGLGVGNYEEHHFDNVVVTALR